MTYRVQSNECGGRPREGENVTIQVSFDPWEGNAPYIEAGARFRFTDPNGQRWGPIILNWPQLEITVPDDQHDHVHYWYTFSDANHATSEMIYHQVGRVECRIDYVPN
jgi:hypothetical protein